MAALLLAVHWSNTITTGSVLIAAILSLIGFAELVHIVRRKNRITDLEAENADLQREMENADRAAKRWEVELRAAQASEQRVALEQQELRHDLKDKLAACQLELAAANMRTDQTAVLKNQEAIGGSILEGQKAIVDVIERMEERAARRDSAMLENQKKIALSLDEIADRVSAKVADVVQEKVDQLQSDLPSPDRQE